MKEEQPWELQDQPRFYNFLYQSQNQPVEQQKVEQDVNQIINPIFKRSNDRRNSLDSFDKNYSEEEYAEIYSSRLEPPNQNLLFPHQNQQERPHQKQNQLPPPPQQEQLQQELPIQPQINQHFQNQENQDTNASNNRRSPREKNKNNVGNIARKGISLIFKQHRKTVQNLCSKMGISFTDFRRKYSKPDSQLTGPIDFAQSFRVDSTNKIDVKMDKLARYIFHKLLRKHYTIYWLKVGKMQNKESYIRTKNKHMLYCLTYLQQLRQYHSQ